MSVVLLGALLGGCHGSDVAGDPVQGGQLPQAEAGQNGASRQEGSQNSNGSASNRNREDSSARKVGVPKILRITEINDLASFNKSVLDACHGKSGCLHITANTVTDPNLNPGAACTIDWTSTPARSPADSNGDYGVPYGATITVTNTCPPASPAASPESATDSATGSG